MEKVAIIGMGSSGMGVLAAYEKEVDPSLVSIDCYDSSDSMGRGYPYREDSNHLLLNLKTRKLSYDYENNDDLADWLDSEGIEKPVYTPRPVFGDYTKSRMNASAKNFEANLIEEKIVRIDKNDDKWELETEAGETRIYDRVHLCFGELNQNDYYNLADYPNYINNIYPVSEKLKDIESGNILVIGAGLSGVDVSTYLLNENKGDFITMFSRTCVIPTVRVDPVDAKVNIFTMERLEEHLANNYNRMTFKEFDELFLEELESHGIDFNKFTEFHMCGGIEGLRRNIENPDDLAIVQAILPPMNDQFNRVWDSLPDRCRLAFKEKYHPLLTLNRSPLPLESAEILIKAEEEKRFNMVKGVKDIKYTGGNYQLILNDDSVYGLEYDYAINATGLDIFMRKIEDVNPLLAQMLNKRYVGLSQYGGLAAVPETMEVISPRYGSLDNLHAHGVLVSGVQYRNNSTMMIQKTAHRLIKSLYK